MAREARARKNDRTTEGSSKARHIQSLAATLASGAVAGRGQVSAEEIYKTYADILDQLKAGVARTKNK